MIPADKPLFVALLTSVHDMYRKDVSTFAVSVWWSACESFSLEQLQKAFTAHAMDPERGHFAPMPADIVRVLRGTQTDRSLIAWGKVLDAIQRVGAYASVVFDDGAIHAAISDMGGWTKVCRSDEKELPFLQKRFTDAHKAYAARPELAYPSVLIGEHEHTNRMNGKPVAPPALVGDPRKAQLVLAGGTDGPKTMITTFHAAATPLRIGKGEAA